MARIKGSQQNWVRQQLLAGKRLNHASLIRDCGGKAGWRLGLLARRRRDWRGRPAIPPRPERRGLSRRSLMSRQDLPAPVDREALIERVYALQIHVPGVARH